MEFWANQGHEDMVVKNHGLVCKQPSSSCKTWERMLHHRPAYWADCWVVWILCITWCSRKAVRCKAQYREFALTNHRWNSNLGFQTLCLWANIDDRILLI